MCKPAGPQIDRAGDWEDGQGFALQPEPERLQIHVSGEPHLPTLVYLPGLHGDWTLVRSFEASLAGRVRFVRFIYPRTVEWSLPDYAERIAEALALKGIHRGWLLAESFGSQVAWPLCVICSGQEGGACGFTPEGMILAGGFVRHPFPWGVRFLRRRLELTPTPWLRRFLVVYAHYARFRHRHAPETLAGIPEFVARRTALDRQAILHRLDLIARNDPGLLARQTRLPVHYLAGLVDPLVPCPWVRRWLRANCPGYRGGTTIWRADHNVLCTAPATAADQVVQWMGQAPTDRGLGE